MYLLMYLNCWPYHLTVQRPMVTVDSVTSTAISISWTSSGTFVDGYEVLWERDTSGQCPYVDVNSADITDGSTRFSIRNLQEDSRYGRVVCTVIACVHVTVSISMLLGKST